MKSHPFVAIFAEAWAEPSLDSLMAPLRDDVMLVQPLSGKKAARAAFAKILYRFPGLRGEVRGGASGDDGILFIDWTMFVSVGSRTLAVPVVDRFEFAENAVKRRDAFFDHLPILTAVATSPVTLIRHARSFLPGGT